MRPKAEWAIDSEAMRARLAKDLQSIRFLALIGINAVNNSFKCKSTIALTVTLSLDQGMWTVDLRLQN